MNAAISVLILTKNEEQDLPDCLESVSWSDDVHVYDSFSEDQTVAIAKTMGTIVTLHVFEGYASQRNAHAHHPGAGHTAASCTRYAAAPRSGPQAAS